MPGKDSEGGEGNQPEPRSPRSGHRRPTFSDFTNIFATSRRTSSVALTGIFLLGLIAFLRYAQAFVIPIVFAVIFHFLLQPVVTWLARLRITRGWGAGLVLAVFIGALVVGISALQEPVKEWVGKAPESLGKVQEAAHEFIRRVEQFTGSDGRQDSATSFNFNPTPSEPAKTFKLADTILNYTTLITTASFLSGFLEKVVLLYFLLATGDRFLQTLVRVLPHHNEKEEMKAIVHVAQQNISRFLFRISAINACVGLLVALAMLVLGMPNPILWGVVAGFLNFIPYFGPFIGCVVLVLAGLLSFDTAGRALLPALVYLGLHAVEANVVTPAVLGRRLTLSPLVIFVALMFWTWVWGVAGALLAVPLLMAFKIVCLHVKPLGPIGELIGG
jgi:predicted PurR-regulated permease PerM